MWYEILALDRKVIGRYAIDPMPGCSAVGISHGLFIEPEFRGKGFGRRAYEERIANAKAQGFQTLICTVVDDNNEEEPFMVRNGWKVCTMFDNPKTGNRVRLWERNLSDPYDCGFFSGHGCR